MQDAALCGNDELTGIAVLGIFQERGGGTDLVGQQHYGFLAFGMNKHLGTGMRLFSSTSFLPRTAHGHDKRHPTPACHAL